MHYIRLEAAFALFRIICNSNQFYGAIPWRLGNNSGRMTASPGTDGLCKLSPIIFTVSTCPVGHNDRDK